MPDNIAGPPIFEMQSRTLCHKALPRERRASTSDCRSVTWIPNEQLGMKLHFCVLLLQSLLAPCHSREVCAIDQHVTVAVACGLVGMDGPAFPDQQSCAHAVSCQTHKLTRTGHIKKLMEVASLL